MGLCFGDGDTSSLFVLTFVYDCWYFMWYVEKWWLVVYDVMHMMIMSYNVFMYWVIWDVKFFILFLVVHCCPNTWMMVVPLSWVFESDNGFWGISACFYKSWETRILVILLMLLVPVWHVILLVPVWHVMCLVPVWHVWIASVAWCSKITKISRCDAPWWCIGNFTVGP